MSTYAQILAVRRERRRSAILRHLHGMGRTSRALAAIARCSERTARRTLVELQGEGLVERVGYRWVRAEACGTKAKPGKCHGVSGHAWRALVVVMAACVPGIGEVVT